MPRSRNIKPSLFTNELLGTQDPIVTLTFVGLWCLADRDGILEDRPLRIKAELFPYRENLCLNGYLTVLQQLGFLHRYEVNGLRYIQIINFTKHQSPHSTEKGKNFPKYQGLTSITVKERLSNGEITVAERPDSLIPDSLIPDLLIDEEPKKAPATSAKSPTQTATRLGQGWGLPNEWEQWARTERPDLDPIKTANAFKDYWIGVPGVKGKKLDWFATWRNWVRRQDATPARGNAYETAYQRTQRERVAEFSPGLARQAPGELPIILDITSEVRNVAAIERS